MISSKDLANWNKRVARAKAQSIYIGNKVSMKQYQNMTAGEKRSFQSTIKAVKGKRTRNLRTVKQGKVEIWTRQQEIIDRKAKALYPKQAKLKKELGSLNIYAGGKKTARKAKNSQEFRELFPVAKTPFNKAKFRSVEGVETYIDSFLTDPETILKGYKEEFIAGIDRNIEKYVLDGSQISRLEAIKDKILSMEDKEFFKLYISNPELNVKENFQEFYPLIYGNSKKTDYYARTEDYINTLERIYEK